MALPRPLWLLLVSLALVFTGLLGGPALARADLTATGLTLASPLERVNPSTTVYLPSRVRAGEPLQVLLLLHGMGSDGPSFAAPVLAQAERNGWLVLAPTFRYGDWRDPDQVRLDDAELLPRLKVLVDNLPVQTGLEIQPRVLIYGFSRGGQLAHRFAQFYPGSTLGLASLACGTYTLPETRASKDGTALSLRFPFGLADLDAYTGRPLDLEALRQVSFLIGVGARDTVATDLPRQWDPYLGTTRVERAQSYQRALTALGVPAQLMLFPNTVHGETDEMRTQALEFLYRLES